MHDHRGGAVMGKDLVELKHSKLRPDKSWRSVGRRTMAE
jgi:hypothetical protein